MCLSQWNKKSVATALFLLACLWIKTTSHQIKMDMLGNHLYVEGDIMLALMEVISHPTNVPGGCYSDAKDVSVLQRIKAVQFAIQEINMNNSILPDIKLGYLVLDDCRHESAVLMRALALRPKNKYCYDELEGSSYRDVVGVIACSWSTGSRLTSLTLAPFNIPVISHLATTDSLGNKEKYPNFFRLIPPDKHQTKAVMEFVLAQGWTRISIIHTQGIYGMSAYRSIRRLSETMGVCVDARISISYIKDTNQCINIVKTLLYAYRARVVVVFVSDKPICLIRAVEHLKVQDQLVWIGSDAWTPLFSETTLHPNFPPAVFVFSFQYVDVPGFREFLSRTDTDQQFWFEKRLENTEFCQSIPCNVSHIMSSYGPSLVSAVLYDVVHTYAYAIQSLMRHKCINVAKDNVNTCICENRKEFTDFVKRTHFYGLTGLVSFDETGSRPSMYNILRARVDNKGKILREVVAIYDIKSHGLLQTVRDLWSGFKDKDVPESTCTKPCLPGEVKIRLGCCWICEACKSNEIVSEDKSKCISCGDLTQPDDYRTRCVLVPQTFPLHISHVGVIITVVLVVLGLTSTQLILLAYFIYRDHVAIQSSNIVLSVSQLISILIGYIAVLLFLSVPTEKICTAAFILLSFSFNTLSGVALQKAIGLYDIPQSHFVLSTLHNASNEAMVFIIILIQVAAQIGLNILKPIGVGRRRGKDHGDVVEIYCLIHDLRITLFLIVDSFLLLLCAYFSFQTKKVPNSFPETRYVAICVSSTIITWMAFMPALNLLDHTAVQTLLLCYMVILNLMTATVFLFCVRLRELFKWRRSTLAQEFTDNVRKPKKEESIHSASSEGPQSNLSITEASTSLSTSVVIATD